MKRGFTYELPPGCERKILNGGEVYMDHITKRTSWDSIQPCILLLKIVPSSASLLVVGH